MYIISMAKENIHDGHRARMREKMLKYPDSLTDHELLECLLYCALPRIDTNPIAHELLNTFGSLSDVLNASIPELTSVSGIGASAAMLIKTVGAVAVRSKSTPSLPTLRTAKDIAAHVHNLAASKPNEMFYLFCLDMQLRLLHTELISEGGISSVNINARKLAHVALRYNASSVVIAHTHPTGVPEPSINDIESTKFISELFSPLEITLLDHVIVTGRQYFSFSHNALLLCDGGIPSALHSSGLRGPGTFKTEEF